MVVFVATVMLWVLVPGAPQFGGTAASVISQVWLWGFGLKVSKIINLSPES